MSEARDLILGLMGDLGLTQAEIARHLGRSPDMVRLVRQGKRPGNNLVDALGELRTTGHVSYEHLPPRRRRKDGKLAAVRAPMGDWKPEPVPKGEKPKSRPTRAPQDPKDPEQRKERRHRYAADRQVFQGGARKLDLHSPRKPDAKGRKEAEETVLAELRSVGRSQSARNRTNPATGQPRGYKKAKFFLTYEDGRRIELGGRGGYYVSARKGIRGSKGLIQNAHDSGGFFEWLDQEVSKTKSRRGSAELVAGKRIVNLEMTTFYSSAEEEAKGVHDKRSIHD